MLYLSVVHVWKLERTSWTKCASKTKYDHYSCILRCKYKCVLYLVDCISSEMWCDCVYLFGLIASHMKCDMIMYYVWLGWLHLILNVMWSIDRRCKCNGCQRDNAFHLKCKCAQGTQMRVPNVPLERSALHIESLLFIFF